MLVTYFFALRDVTGDVIHDIYDVIHDINQQADYVAYCIFAIMSNLSMVHKTDDVSTGDDSTPPQPVTVLQAADIPKASTEALDLLKCIGKYYKLF